MVPDPRAPAFPPRSAAGVAGDEPVNGYSPFALIVTLI
jgi:hypothetical protein